MTGAYLRAAATRALRTRLLLTRLERVYAQQADSAAPTPLPAGGWRRALVVAPHADDEVIGCGGLVRHLARAGTEVVVTVLTRDGVRSLGSTAAGRADEIRVAESRAAQAVLGYAHRRQFDFGDRALCPAGAGLHALTSALDEALAYWNPDLIAFPNASDLHPDHVAAARAARLAWRRRIDADASWTRRTALAYEVWGPCRAHWELPLEAADVALKQRALACYESQLEIADYTRVMAFVHERRARLARRYSAEGCTPWSEGYELIAPEEAA